MGHYSKKSQALPEQKQIPAPTHEEGAEMAAQLAAGAKVARVAPKVVDLKGKALVQKCKKCKEELTAVCLMVGKCYRCEFPITSAQRNR